MSHRPLLKTGTKRAAVSLTLFLLLGLLMAPGARSQHRAAIPLVRIGKACESVCVDFDDGSPDRTYCTSEVEVENSSDPGTTLRIIGAWDTMDPKGSHVRVPPVGNLPIREICGNATCTSALPGAVCQPTPPLGPCVQVADGECTLPCILGTTDSGTTLDPVTGLSLPGHQRFSGQLGFVQNLYDIQLEDPIPLPDQVSVRFHSVCNPGPPGCAGNLPNVVQFTAATVWCAPEKGCTPELCAHGACDQIESPDCNITETHARGGENEFDLCSFDFPSTLCGPDTPDGATWRYSWLGPEGFTSTSQCITLPETNDAGVYCLTVTNEVTIPHGPGPGDDETLTCSAMCCSRLAYVECCDDGILHPHLGETCEPPGQPAGANNHVCRDDCTVCGDGVVDPEEECDDGNSDDNDGCRNDCTFCGSGVLQPQHGETCDPPAADSCVGDCRVPGEAHPCTCCGDGSPQPASGETCDPPGTAVGPGGNACRDDCTACGDKVLQSQHAETCDPPGDTAPPYGNTCRGDCTVCGDSILQIENDESCDPPGSVVAPHGNACRGDCTVCGDGLLDAEHRETCDPPGAAVGPSGNPCRLDCTYCGDGVLDPGEDCDDANNVQDDGCNNSCRYKCGDGGVTAPETCDPPAGATCLQPCRDPGAIDECTCCGDGNIDAASGETCDLSTFGPDSPLGRTCEPDCTFCGDGLTQSENGESCDDGNSADDDDCRNDCTFCGDDLLQPGGGETCDPPGAAVPPYSNACRDDCTVCGDGLVQPGHAETCDPPGAPAGPNGNDCRIDCTVCGDGVVDSGEECDDGNADPNDGCRNDCTFCGSGVIQPQHGETCDPQAPDTCVGVCRAAGGPDQCTCCGDGELQPASGERCDPPGDPVPPYNNACRNDCTACGDSVVQSPHNETCDPPGASAGAIGNLCRNDCSVCGDGIVQVGEDCDDGNNVNCDGCNNDCLLVCGDCAINLPQETCDGTADAGCFADCRPVATVDECTCCGDNVLQAGSGETCDRDQATGCTQACREDCTCCGDSAVQLGETCDRDQAAGCSLDCRANCTCCGDGVLQTADGEKCDPPGAAFPPFGNACRNDCTYCGDGTRQSAAGETCDIADDDRCSQDCRSNCTCCGDGLLQSADGEKCDPPGLPVPPYNHSCRGDCTVCGDDTVQSAHGETCDGGNATGCNLACRNDCTCCGDGRTQGPHGETCDDGNANPADSCRNDCTRCGDVLLQPQHGEQCDGTVFEPGAPSGRACRGDCTFCGDGIVQPEHNEHCDDGNSNSNDGCNNTCRFKCGDGRVVAPETCDPPADDACVGTCRPAGSGPDECTCCGDGVLQAAAGETCDPPGSFVGPSGNRCLDTCTFCGDGVVDPGEDCDDGNNVDCDGCSNACVFVCGDCDVNRAAETCDGSDAAECFTGCRIPGGVDECTCCGDGTIQSGSGETCDRDNAGTCNLECRDDCTCCGDGVAQPTHGETCDDENTDPNDACRNDCTRCGDLLIQTPHGETCDGTTAAGCSETCRAFGAVDACTCCGDGLIQSASDETCDGSTFGPGAPAERTCRPDCTFCGDGIVDPGEDCDDGNDVAIDGCNNSCRYKCGDGGVTGTETCDPPADHDCVGQCRPGGSTDECTCCGDGALQPMSNETCDPPGDPAGNVDNLCRDDCTVCGDDVVQATHAETCDPPGSTVGPGGSACRPTCTYCGDGIVDPEEDCDDANNIQNDGCDNSCRYKCGDGGVTGAETCDPPAPNACIGPCRSAGAMDECTCCGDGQLQSPSGETCDPPGKSVPPFRNTCRDECTVCGDGVLQSKHAETCDPPGATVGPNRSMCRGDCTYCGDGVVDPKEECDDGNSDDNDGCRNDCTFCGSGMIQPQHGETCDPPGVPFPPFGNDCRATCTYCGDSLRQADEAEACDGADAAGCNLACRSDCTCCGDGTAQSNHQEACDDGNSNPDDGCRNDCTRCGDAVVQAGHSETCDPPGHAGGFNGNLCRNTCTVCGDGISDPGEFCDDGNGIDDDGCRNDCTRCGDGTIQTDHDEECDGSAGDCAEGCNLDSCTCIRCGDGRVNRAEETCDPPDPDPLAPNACRVDCTRCGDGILHEQNNEQCDGNSFKAGLPVGAVCRSDCTLCGDGLIQRQHDEECDGQDLGGCTSACDDAACRCVGCGDGVINQPGETCEPPGTPVPPYNNPCRDNCTVCGDGVRQTSSAETCDGADATGCNAACRPNCTCCGDGIVDPPEECDDGNALDFDGCSNACTRPEECPGPCPPITKAKADIWNEDGHRFSGTERCIGAFDSELLGRWTRSRNNFWRTFLQTNHGKARIDGLASTVCGNQSIDAPLLGVAARIFTFPAERTRAASELVGMGFQPGRIRYVPGGGPAPVAAGVAPPTDVASASARGETAQRLSPGQSPSPGADIPAASQTTAQGRACTSCKGSLLVFPKIELKWDAAGRLIEDTVIELTNDNSQPVRVQMYLVHGERCGWTDVALTLTLDQPTYWSAATGLPAGVSPFTVAGEPCVDDDPDNPGARRLRGSLVVWAVDPVNGTEIAWNHLAGGATLIRYDETSAWEYGAWAFRSVPKVAEGAALLSPLGQLDLDGVEYESTPDQLLLDFFSSNTVLPGPPGQAPQVDTDLTLWLGIQDFDVDDFD